MLKNIQTDPKWGSESMGMEGDLIRVYGCFLTALANILEVTPLELNKRFQIENVYNGKQYPGEESELNYTRARRVLGISFRLIKETEIDQQHIENVIICIKNPKSPTGIHFVNCLNMTKIGIKIFDTYDGHEYEIMFHDIIGAYALYK